MQLSNIPAKLLLAFAAAGGRNDIPVGSQIATSPGAASYADGFPPLTRTPIVAGGTPPSGLDMNGVLYELSALICWLNAGGGFPYDGTFADNPNVGGYPKGARVMRSGGAGYWLNTADNNKVDPESVVANQAASAGWVPDMTNGIASIAMTNANVTLTPAQYGKPVIVITGALVANLNLIFPNLSGEWVVVNNCTGNQSITCKTASGTGVLLNPGRTKTLIGDGVNIYPSSNEGNRLYTFIYSANQTIAASQFGSLLEYNGGTDATFTLPSPSGASGQGFVVWNNSAQNLTLSTPSGQFVGPGVNNSTTVVLRPQEVLEVCSDTYNYVRIGANGGNRLYTFIYSANQTIAASQFGSLLEYNGGTDATFTLPSPSGASGQGFVVWNNSAQNLTLSTPSGQFVGPGVNNSTTVVLRPQEVLEVCSDTYNYVRIGANGGNRLYTFIYSANQTIAASQFGSLLEYNGGANATFTLPSPSGASGQGFVVWNNSAQNLTLSTPSGQFVGPGINNSATVVLRPQEVLEVCSDAYSYVRIGGTGASTFGSPGMFVLDSGIIVQWANGYNFTGTSWQTFNWPVAFPNSGLIAVGFGAGVGMHNVAINNYTASGFQAFASTSGGTALSTTFSLIAIGY